MGCVRTRAQNVERDPPKIVRTRRAGEVEDEVDGAVDVKPSSGIQLKKSKARIAL